MPTYDYHCTQCQYNSEELQKITAAPLTLCPSCGESTYKRQIGAGLQPHFSGSGFYCTDYSSLKSSDE